MEMLSYQRTLSFNLLSHTLNRCAGELTMRGENLELADCCDVKIGSKPTPPTGLSRRAGHLPRPQGVLL